MTENTSHEASENNEPTVLFGIQTPLGKVEVKPSDLPEVLRHAITESLERQDMPKELREAFTKALNTATPEAQDSDTGEANGASEPATADSTVHECSCAADSHREQVWDIIDTAFPDDPHLWNAMESLFKLSAANPVKLTAEARTTVIDEAILHLGRQVNVATSPLSHEEQLVADFRKELGL